MSSAKWKWIVGFGLCFAALTLAGLLWWDAPVANAIREGAGKNFKNTARFFSRYGDFPYLLGAGILALGWIWWRGLWHREWSRIIVAMILSSVLAGLASNVIKLGAGRVRPRVTSVEQGWHGPRHNGKWVSLDHDFQSFPSSHAACAFGFFFPLFFSRRAAGLVGLVAAGLVSWSRIQLNAHHVSDIATGALIGLLAGWLVWHWIVKQESLSRWLPASSR